MIRKHTISVQLYYNQNKKKRITYVLTYNAHYRHRLWTLFH